MREITTKRARYLYSIKNAEMNGGLDEYLKESRELGASLRKIAAELSQSGAAVGKTAVFNWINETSTTN